MSRAAAIFLLSSGVCSGALEYPNDLAQWVVAKPLEAGPWTERYYSAHHDTRHEWHVFLRDGRPSARLKSRNEPVPPPLPFAIEKGTYAEGLNGDRLSVKVADGWIVSFNGGEFGAGLWWFSPDGLRRDRISLNKEWINGYFPTEAGLLALEGISHGRTQGQILRLARGDDGRWHSHPFLPLGEEPFLGVKDVDGTLIVATNNRLLRVHPTTKAVDVLVKRVFWSSLYPNSMVLTHGSVYIGMRHGVVKVDFKGRTHQVEWLLPTPEFDQITRVPWGFH